MTDDIVVGEVADGEPWNPIQVRLSDLSSEARAVLEAALDGITTPGRGHYIIKETQLIQAAYAFAMSMRKVKP